ncbi:MAG TPA: Holliday junction ATP-dependent DNA helicase RuvA [Myxococcota bacterium]|nr:Holliday junction ATP-dependent DNA helicase RuvA [Myxococcota bacterium]
MIARLVGRCVARDGGRAVIDVRDVGYAVTGPVRDVDHWARAGEPVVIHVSTDVREDAITLFGFSDDLDRVTFERLRGVEGIGPKVALAVLDALGRERLVRAVEGDDHGVLATTPGVGRKLAQRMALELKGRLPVPVGPAPRAEASEPALLELALARLGYGKLDVARAVEGVAAEGRASEPVAERLRAALRILSQR